MSERTHRKLAAPQAAREGTWVAGGLSKEKDMSLSVLLNFLVFKHMLPVGNNKQN